jgi:eukaryotic-like serine/threonine-protein kinase
MGEVYRAHDPELDREVALKLLHPEATDARQLARFEREARALASVSHPNIVTIYSVEKAEGVSFFTMELVEGKTLGESIPRGGFSFERFLDLAIPLADAVACAHDRGVIHRDLKPGNVMIDGNGRVKVLDFGLARRVQAWRALEGEDDCPTEPGTEPLTVEGKVAGTLPYMSPEQIQGKNADPRSDVFSLGAVLYEMLTGRRAFDGASPAELLSAILRDTPRPVTEACPEVPRHLVRILRRCLEKDPRARYQAVRDVANELAGLREELASEEVVRRHSWSAAPRSRSWRWMAAGGALLIVTALGLSMVRRHEPPRAVATPIIAVLPLLNAGGDPANDNLGIGFADSLITRLTAIPGVRVVSRSAATEVALRGLAPPRVARRLGATHLVVGSFQRAGDRVLVNLSVLGPDGSVVLRSWTDEGNLADIFDLQRRLAAGVSQTLELTLTAADRMRLDRAPARDVHAFLEYSRARELMQRSDVGENVDAAITLLSGAVERDPSFALAHAALGDAFWRRFRATLEPEWAEAARGAIHRAARLDAEDPQVRVSLAQVLDGTGRREEALAQLLEAIARRPDNDDALRELGSILARQGDFGEARETLARAIAIRPDFWENHAALGRLLLREGRFTDAAAAYERASTLVPDNVNVLQNLGVAWQQAGFDALAILSYERAIRVDPDADAALANLSGIYYRAGRFAEAARALERAVAIVPGDPLLHRNLGDVYRRLGEQRKARDAYLAGVTTAQQLLRVNPRDAGSLALQALCEAKLGRHEEAALHARAAIDLNPADATVHFRAAVAHALGGRDQEALAALEEALARGYSVESARADDDLAALSSKPGFAKILGS